MRREGSASSRFRFEKKRCRSDGARAIRTAVKQSHRGGWKGAHGCAKKERRRRRGEEPEQEESHVACGDGTETGLVLGHHAPRLDSPVRGKYCYLYMTVDIFSRFIVGWEIHDEENAQYAKTLVQKAYLKEAI